MQLTGMLPPGELPRLLRGLAELRRTGSLTLSWSQRRATLTFVEGELVRLTTNACESENGSERARIDRSGNDQSLIATLEALCYEGHGWFYFEETYHPPATGRDIQGLLRKLPFELRESSGLSREPSHACGESFFTLHAPALARLLRELQEHAGLDSTIEKLLDFSMRFVDRAAVLIATPVSFALEAVAGDALGGDPERERRVLRSQPSVLNEVVETGAMILGPLPPDEGNRALVQMLGSSVPTSSVVIPLASAKQLGAVFYGDVLGDSPILGTELLETAVRATSLCLRGPTRSTLAAQQFRAANRDVGPRDQHRLAEESLSGSDTKNQDIAIY